MLRQQIKNTQISLSIGIVILAPCILYFLYVVFKDEDWSWPAKIFAIIIGAAIALGIIFLRYMIQIRLGLLYLNALQNQDKIEALTCGRSYYGIRRFGFSGVGGDKITAADEQAINNDIQAYSTT